MTTYTLWAIREEERATVRDRYRLEASSFAEACLIAQENEIAYARYNEPTIYNEFKQID